MQTWHVAGITTVQVVQARGAAEFAAGSNVAAMGDQIRVIGSEQKYPVVLVGPAAHHCDHLFRSY